MISIPKEYCPINYRSTFVYKEGTKTTQFCIQHQNQYAFFFLKGMSSIEYQPGLCSHCAVDCAKKGYEVEEL